TSKVGRWSPVGPVRSSTTTAGCWRSNTDRRRLLPKLEAAGCRRHQIGDEEARLLFPPDALPAVAGVIGARRKRAVSPEQARNLAAGTATRFTKQPVLAV